MGVDCDSSHNTQKMKTLYLTFRGLTRFLFVTRNKNAEYFQDWACRILFTHRMGHQDQKDDLADELIGTHIGTVRDVFRSSVSSFPSIYLIEFGLVKDLRGNLQIGDNVPDDHKIYKFGTTHDLKERLVLYNHQYGRSIGLQLIMYAYIDVLYKVSAEKDVRDYCNKQNIRLNTREEFIVLHNDASLKKLKSFFKRIHDCYIGSVRQCQEKMTEMEHERDLLLQENKHLKEQVASLEKDKSLLQTHIGVLFKFQSKYESCLEFIKSLCNFEGNLRSVVSDYLLS